MSHLVFLVFTVGLACCCFGLLTLRWHYSLAYRFGLFIVLAAALYTIPKAFTLGGPIWEAAALRVGLFIFLLDQVMAEHRNMKKPHHANVTGVTVQALLGVRR